MKLKIVLSFIILLNVITEVLSQNLQPGQPAPDFKVEKWIKNGGFDHLQKGKVYIIDLWAIWCTPCIASMPHLSKLQKKYKNSNVEVVGITNVDAWGNTLEKVTEFVQKKDTLLDYHIAWVPASMNKDSLCGIFVHPWMQAIGSMNLPTAFIVDKMGIIAYIGDPLTIDQPLDQLVNDHYDIELAKSNYRSGLQAEALLPKIDSALNVNNLTTAMHIGNQILNNFSFVKPNTYLVLSSRITDTKTMNEALLSIALTAAKRSLVATQFESPGFYDVVATAYAAKGDYIMAYALEKMAIVYSDGEMKRNQMKKLEQYLKRI